MKRKGFLIAVIILICLCFSGCLTSDDAPNPATASTSAVIEPTTGPASEPATEPATQPTTEPATESATQSTTEPATEPATQPTTEPATEPATQPTTEPATEPATQPTTEPPHIHNFSAATCTEPKTCSCGATDGEPNGHSWKDTTCLEPQTCTVCGAGSGLPAGHVFTNGKCISCGASDPDYTSEIMVWIPTRGGKKHHTRATCSNMIDPEYVTQTEAESRGFTPCKKCH